MSFNHWSPIPQIHLETTAISLAERQPQNHHPERDGLDIVLVSLNPPLFALVLIYVTYIIDQRHRYAQNVVLFHIKARPRLSESRVSKTERIDYSRTAGAIRSLIMWSSLLCCFLTVFTEARRREIPIQKCEDQRTTVSLFNLVQDYVPLGSFGISLILRTMDQSSVELGPRQDMVPGDPCHTPWTVTGCFRIFWCSFGLWVWYFVHSLISR